MGIYVNPGNEEFKRAVNSKIYVDLFPCNECAKIIIQSGIKEVIYLSDKYENTNSTIASKKMLNMAGIKLTKYHGKILVPEFVGDKENV